MKKGEYKIRHTVRQKLLALALTVFLLLPVLPVLKASAATFELEVTYGLNNTVRVGRSAAFNVTVTNNGNDFEGTVQIIVNDRSRNYMYEKDISISKGATKTVSITIPMQNYTTAANVRIADSKGRVKQAKTVSVKVAKALLDFNIGVLSDDFSALSYLEGIVLYTTNYGDIGTHIYEMDETNFPEDAEAFDLLDAVLISNFSTDRLSTAQLDAFNSWVEKGGILIIGTGSTFSKTISGLKSLPITKALGNTNIRYTTYETSYGLRTTDSAITGSSYVGQGYDNYGYDNLSSFGMTTYNNVINTLDAIIADLVADKEAVSAGKVDAKLVMDRYFSENREYIWNTFSSWFGYYYTSDEEKANLDYSLKSDVFYNILEPIITERLNTAIATLESQGRQNTSDSAYVSAEIAEFSLDTAFGLISGDIRNSSESYILAKYYNYAYGAVIVAGMDFTQNPLASYKDNVSVFRSILKQSYGTTIYNAADAYYKNAQNQYYSNDYYMYSELSDSLTAAAAPPVLLYVLILIAYLVSIFVSFNILKKKHKNVMFWATQVGLAIAFSIVIFLCSFTTRLRNAELRSVNIKELSVYGERNTNLSALIMPKKKVYKFTASPDLNLKNILIDYDYYYNQNQPSLDTFNIGINQRLDSTVFTVNNNATLNKELFLGSSINSEQQGSLTIQSLDNNEYLVTNTSGYDLEKVFLAISSGIYLLGDLSNGQSMSTESAFAFVTRNSGSYIARKEYREAVNSFLTGNDGYGIFELLFGTNNTGYRKVMSRRALFDYILNYTSGQIIVGGFSDDASGSKVQTDGKFKESAYDIVYQEYTFADLSDIFRTE